MRMLITGASGLLGLNLALEAQALEAEAVFGVVNRNSLQTGRFTVVQADLTAPGELERVLDETQPDWVINCAALAIVDDCEAHPDLAYRLNAELPQKLAAHVGRGGARLLHISTDAVFDGQHGGYTEADEPNPLSVYARSKQAGEQAVLETDPQAIVARVNLYGWSLLGTRSLAEWFFYKLQAGQEMMGFTDVYFCPLLANDLARILFQMLGLNLTGLYHAVSSDCSSKYDFGAALARQFGLDASLIRPTSVSQAGLKAARSPLLTLRSDKLAGALGESLPNLSTGLERFHALYQQGYPHMLQDLRADG